MIKYCLIISFLGFISCKNKPETLFERIDNADSGIDFNNKIISNDTLNAFNFTNFYNGGGVGIGNFNHDSLPDLFFTGNQVKSRIYTNLGEFKFEDVTEKSGINTDHWCSGVSVIDINQDGWDDVYISVAQHPSMKNTKNLLYINQKTQSPTFKEEAQKYGLDYAGFTTQTAFFDYDLDGDLDAFMLNTNPDLQNPSYLRPVISDGSYPTTDKLFRNEGKNEAGNIVFKDVSKEAGILYEGLGLGLVISDLNKDGFPDIYCSNDFLSNDILYLNNGNGTFTNTIRSSVAHTSMSGMGVDAADLNNDLKTDIMQLDMLPEDNERQKQMLGTQDFDRKEMSISPQYNYQLQYMRNSLQINQGNENGKPMFSEMGLLAGVAKTDWSWATLLTDLNNDGRKDIFITNGYRKNVTDKDFITYNNTNNVFGTDKNRNKVRESLLEKIPEIKLKNYAYQNISELRFENTSETWGLDELSYASGAAYADLDLDGDNDLVINNIDQDASIFKNKTNEKNTHNFLKIKLEGSKNNRSGIGAKVTIWTKGNAQYIENFPIRGFLSSVESGVLFGLGNNKIIDSLEVIWADNFSEKQKNLKANQTITLNHEQAYPYQFPAFKQNSLFKPVLDLISYQHLESNFVDFKQTPALHKMLSRNGCAIATGDLNNDNLSDVMVGGAYQGSTTTIFLQQKNGKFLAKKWQENSEMEVGDILIFDADNDKDNDVLLVGGSNEKTLTDTRAFQPTLFLNDGKGKFHKSNHFPSITVNSQVVKAFDFDGDNDLDIFIGGRQIPNQYPYTPNSYFLKNENGHFTDVTKTYAPATQNLGMVCDALPIDYDKDNDTDLIVVGEWMYPVLIENNQRKSFNISQNQPLANQTGWWNCISAADFDRDGDLDLLLGNEGLNSFYHASPEEPVQLLAKDFNLDGTIDPIMGHFIHGKCVPVLPRETLIQQIVQFRKKYLTFADYAKADFKDLFTNKDLEGVMKSEAKQLRSCYAENKGKGNFICQALPILTQQSPIYGFVVQDFDKDGLLDAVATGNFYANEANMGRQDASNGLFLKGNGKGKFAVQNGISVGLSIKGDARKSVFIPEKKLLITAINDGVIIMSQELK